MVKHRNIERDVEREDASTNKASDPRRTSFIRPSGEVRPLSEDSAHEALSGRYPTLTYDQRREDPPAASEPRLVQETPYIRRRTPTLPGYHPAPAVEREAEKKNAISQSVPKNRPSQRPRKYVSVEMVGVTAMDLARETRKTLAPKVVATRQFILQSPLGALELFFLGFINGKRSEADLSDVTGWTREEVREGLDLLVRLGIVTMEYV